MNTKANEALNRLKEIRERYRHSATSSAAYEVRANDLAWLIQEVELCHARVDPPTGKSDGVEVIRAERKRQVLQKGYTPEHDDGHEFGELGLAAALYALPYGYEMGNEPLITQSDFINLHITLETGCDFILPPEPDRLRRLAKAGALIAAEIDRLERIK